MEDGKPFDYGVVAERLRDAAQAALSTEARAQLLMFATIYDNLARADEAIGRSRDLLPLPPAVGPCRSATWLTLARGAGTVLPHKEPDGGRANAMTKSDLVQRLAEANPHLYHREAEVIVTAIFDEIAAALTRGERVELRGFGAFTVKKRAAHMGLNPATGESVSVSEKHHTYFRTSRQLRDRLNRDEAATATDPVARKDHHLTLA